MYRNVFCLTQRFELVAEISAGHPLSVPIDGLVNDHVAYVITVSGVMHGPVVQWRSCRPAF